LPSFIWSIAAIGRDVVAGIFGADRGRVKTEPISIELADLAREPGGVWGGRERLFYFFRVGLIAVSAFLSSTSPPHPTARQKTAFGPSGGDFSLEKTGLMR